ncbi:MAG: N-acetyl-alpha-D-glucosaminyl L-malate synthase BshA [Bacteroidetes bacterium 47-18]|nr:MAG: N-acetyl-alpha-D-glucosaminyl L-malate synthase BshA [Bacteroidetes bacterium 47-18]
MRIGIVCYPTFGGSGVMATELGLALAKKGHEIHFITYKQPVRLNGFQPNVYFHEVSVPAYPLFDFPPYETSLASTIVNVSLNHQLDLLHVHYAIPHASSAYFAKQILREYNIDLPFITTLHGTDITLVGRDKSYTHIVDFSINQSDAVTAVSENLKAETLKHFCIQKDIHVITNFIDPGRFRIRESKLNKSVFAPNGEKILVHVSNFRKVKRVEDVIKIFEKVNKVLPSKLLMIGDGPERQSAEETCRSLGICSDIRYLGKQEQLEEILSLSDLFLLTSEYESFGLAALEAMACGIPIITTNAGGLVEVNKDGYSGYLSDVGDVEKMAEDAISILNDEETLLRFKQNALAQANLFSIDKLLPQYENLYFEVTGKTS